MHVELPSTWGDPLVRCVVVQGEFAWLSAAACVFVIPGHCSIVWVCRMSWKLKSFRLKSSWCYQDVGHLTGYCMSLWKRCSKVLQQLPKYLSTGGLEKRERFWSCGQWCHGAIIPVGTWLVKWQQLCCDSTRFYKLRVIEGGCQTTEIGNKASWAWLPKKKPIKCYRQTWGNDISNLSCFHTVAP